MRMVSSFPVSVALYPLLSVFLILSSLIWHVLSSSRILAYSNATATNSHVGIGCRFFSCVFFYYFMLFFACYPSWVMQLIGQGLSWLLSFSLVASLYVILVCPFLPCCLLAGLKGKCFPVAGTAQIIPADYLTNATFFLSYPPPPPLLLSRLASCLFRY